MKLTECTTCGAHSFTDNKCDYCGNQYKTEPTWEEILEAQEQEIERAEEEEEKAKQAKLDEFNRQVESKPFKLLLWIFNTIILFAATIVFPPVCLAVLIIRIVLGIKRLTKIKK